MKKGQIYEGIVEKYAFPNKGYVTVEDRSICIKGALIGQKVRFSIKRLKKGAGEGRLLEVLEKSDIEDAIPDCPHFGRCGGCAYQTMSYENQLRLKEKQVKELLDRVILTVDNFVETVDKTGELSENTDVTKEKCHENVYNSGMQCNAYAGGGYIWEGIKGSPVTTAYRNKMEYSFGDEYKDGPLALGMHKKGGFHDIVTVDQCRIVDEDYNRILRAVLDFYDEKKVPFYKKMQHIGMLRHLVVRQAAGNKDILVNLVTTTREDLRMSEAQGKDVAERMMNDGRSGSVDGEHQRTNNGNGLKTEDILGEKLYLDELKERLLSLDLNGRIVGILHTWNDSLSDAVVPQRVVKLYGQDYLYEDILGLKFKISPFSFFQTNTRSAEVLYETARSYVLNGNEGERNAADGNVMERESTGRAVVERVGSDAMGGSDAKRDKSEYVEKGVIEDKVIFDLYSGTGTIAQMLAPVAKKVVGIEIVEEAVEAARENAALNGLTNCEFIAGDVLKVLDSVEEKPDIIVLDPPRDGCNPKALEKIINYNVPEMVYISCKPTSLVRDLVTLQARGYRVVKACVVDQFPGTLHVETVVLMSRVKD